MKNLLFSTLLLSSFQAFSGQPFITVGSDNACDYHSIQPAIDSEDSTEIRIATNGSPYFEHVEVYSIDMTLKGGYADCQSAAINITDLSRPIIDGQNTGVVVDVRGSLSPNVVALKNLVIGNGDYGIYSVINQVELLIDNVWIFNNNENGVEFTENVDNQVIINDTEISLNQRGGIYCVGSENEITITGDTLIHNNTSLNGGSGIRLREGCQANVYSPTKLMDNKSDGRGGAIAVESGSGLDVYGFFASCSEGICFGDDTKPVIIANNMADANDNGVGSGGAIHVTGQGSLATVFNVVAESNQANKGGAFSATNEAELVVAGYDSGSGCWSKGKCTQILSNEAELGGAFYVSNDAVMFVLASWIKGQNAGNGIAGYLIDGANLTINNSMLVKNGELQNPSSSRLFNMFKGNNNVASTLTLEYVTLSDNELSDVVIRNKESNVRVHSSIINEKVNVYFDDEGLSDSFECIISNEVASINAGGTVIVAAPDFMAPATDDYRLKPNSVAVDYCYEIDSEFSSDMEYEDHGFDDPNKTNLHGTYDIGADEYIIDNDIIFMNGFEQE